MPERKRKMFFSRLPIRAPQHLNGSAVDYRGRTGPAVKRVQRLRAICPAPVGSKTRLRRYWILLVKSLEPAYAMATGLDGSPHMDFPHLSGPVNR